VIERARDGVEDGRGPRHVPRCREA
jgi:hypothetical protein